MGSLWAALGHADRLARATHADAHLTVTAVGAGGKTTLLHALADEAAASGRRVLLTTTTRMAVEPGLVSDPEVAARVLTGDWSALSAQSGRNGAREASSALLSPGAHPTPGVPLEPGLVVVAGQLHGAKFGPFPPADAERVAALADVVLVEGDGSKRLPFKVPAAHEPVVPADTDLLLIVVGLSALGRPLAEVCFRVDEACQVLDDPDAGKLELTADLAATLLSAGYTDRPALAPWAGRRVIVLNQADDEARLGLARELADLLPGERVIATTNRGPHAAEPAAPRV